MSLVKTYPSREFRVSFIFLKVILFEEILGFTLFIYFNVEYLSRFRIYLFKLVKPEIIGHQSSSNRWPLLCFSKVIFSKGKKEDIWSTKVLKVSALRSNETLSQRLACSR